MKVSVISVENSKPNITIAPRPRYNSVPAPGLNTRGDRANMVVIVEIMIGLMRARVLSITASIDAIPLVLMLRIVRSMMRMGLFTTVPIRIRKPSMVITSKGWCIFASPRSDRFPPMAFSSHNPNNPPPIPTGTVVITSSGYPQCEKMATSNK